EKGLITYHRTDSLNLSNQALSGAKKLIEEKYGKKYLKTRKYKTKGRAQEAHEAIRPTFPKKTPSKVKLKDAQFKLYNLIWRRFIASQMKPALYDSTAIDIKANKYTLRTNGRILKFEGFLKVYTFQKKDDPIILPSLKEKEILNLQKVISKQHFTNPPARYNEASLIKELKSNNIGRPSTYAPILSTIQNRNYIIKNNKKRFQPTEIGTVVNDVLTEHFEKIVDEEFTAKMEKELDEVAEGEDGWRKTIKDFYEPFSKNLEKKYDEVEKKDYTNKPTDKKCPKCGEPLLKKLGKFGWFYACSAFPKCKYSKPLERKKLGIKCPKCKKGDLVEKRTRKGKLFYACNQYPDCKFALWNKPITNKEGKIKKCPKCESPLVETDKGKIKCSNKDCKFKKIDKEAKE
ncbi:MAG: DNA topoisomerase, partial [Minisyncoccales bacterium]